jgi:hypothetical protein
MEYERIVKTRKAHTCRGCSARISKGSTAFIIIRSIFQAKYHLHLCTDCVAKCAAKGCKKCLSEDEIKFNFVKECRI